MTKKTINKKTVKKPLRKRIVERHDTKFFSLNTQELSVLYQEVQRELYRRAPKQGESDVDPAAIIRGQEMAKRAVTVAAAGNHSLLLVGPPGAGKTLLRALAHSLGLIATYEVRPCPCGYNTDPRRECKCSAAQIEKHRAEWPETDISIEVPSLPFRELNSKTPGTSMAEMRKYIDASLGFMPPDELDEDSTNLLRAAVSEMGLSAAQVVVIRRVAQTIAALDRSTKVLSQHLCEAINYRSLNR